MNANVVYASSAADRRHSILRADNGLRYERRHQVIMLRRRYRRLRDAGCPARLARESLWYTANDAIFDTTFVPYDTTTMAVVA